MSGALAVFDLGKTNSKLFVFAPDGRLLDERRTRPVWTQFRGRSVLDDEALFAWMSAGLAEAVAGQGVERMMVSAHGCAFALVNGKRLLHPILDYEQEIHHGPAASSKLPTAVVMVRGRCYGRSGGAILPGST